MPAEDNSALRHRILLIMPAFWEASRSWISERQREARTHLPATAPEDGFGNPVKSALKNDK
jgi:hypothetical protein